MNNEASHRLAELADRYWRFECDETPLTAALANVPLPDAVLFRESSADWARRDERAAKMLLELGEIDETILVGQERATHRLLHRELNAVRSHYATRAHLRPWLFPLGPDFTPVFWANSTSLFDTADAVRYLDRLRTLPGFWGDIAACLVQGQAAGVGWPREVLERALAGARGELALDSAMSPFLGPFKRSAARDQVAMANAAARAEELVKSEIKPAQRAYVDTLNSLCAKARTSLSCSDTNGGRDYYRAMVRHFTTSDLTPEAVHELGLAEVTRIGKAIEAVASEAGHVGDVPGYRRFLATDAQFVAPSAAALRAQMESLCKRIDRLIPKFFGRIPRMTYGLESIPASDSAAMPPAYAQPNPADSSASGVFWISGLPAKCPSYIHVPMAVHEAWPGHLMHIALIQEQTDLPTFRRHGSVKYTACIEGWALYCESLAEEMGLYETPHQRYGCLEMELWRAVRLVVDTGIHWHGWSRDRGIEYMSGLLTLAPETIAGEVDRYAGMPAQALGYQIGNLCVRGLRDRSRSLLGDRFKHRDFHDALTGAGAVTLPVLEGLVDEWLMRQQ